MRKTGKSPTNRSLWRGMQILRVFKPGFEVLGNGEIADLTGLPKATISRLTQTLEDGGFLQYDPDRRAYRLGVPVLSLAFSLRSGSSVLRVAAPMMEALARRERINVGMALADQDEMVYLESIRLSHRKSVRTVMPGQRIPMETTSLGRAWLATLPEAARLPLYERFRTRHPQQWPDIRHEIEQAVRDVEHRGYCAASWLPEVVAVASPLRLRDGSVYALNASVTAEGSTQAFIDRIHGPLTDLARQIGDAMP